MMRSAMRAAPKAGIQPWRILRAARASREIWWPRAELNQSLIGLFCRTDQEADLADSFHTTFDAIAGHDWAHTFRRAGID